MSGGLKRILFLLFFVSGFCSLLYQVVWLRLAFASFGIITPVLSLLVSVFMAGLAIGSWGAGRWVRSWRRKTGFSAILLYGLAEFIIGISAFTVPWLFIQGEQLLLPTGEMDSSSYLMLSAAVIVLTILPWCICMGATFPLMMAFVREQDSKQSDSFSFLYLANVLGAMGGAILTPLLFVEFFGFRATLLCAAIGNFTAAMISTAIGMRSPAAETASEGDSPLSGSDRPAAVSRATPLIASILFATGFSSLALEVVWTRAFTPVLQTQVYSFAGLLFTYLLATWAGSQWYRRDLKHGRVAPTPKLMAYLAMSAFMQVVLDDPRVIFSTIPLLLTIVPFCGILGYLTPKLIDEWSGGQADAAGKAYAVNVIGCIIGPLVASYLLLPTLGVKWSMVVLSMPFVPLVIWSVHAAGIRWQQFAPHLLVTGVLALIGAASSSSYEELWARNGAAVRRDHTATIISIGQGMQKELLVNGIGITEQSPITKVMAHLPLAFHEQKPESALVICFGMGTTYRALLSWDVNATAVELVPSVRDAFPYYFDDAAQVMQNPKGRIVIDDGRRFLKRTADRFDVITLDPPPPVEAAGSSLLYSEEFYHLVKQRLSDRGILQQWFPGGERLTLGAMLRSVTNVFPHVIVLNSVEGWGVHILASEQPLRMPTPQEFAARIPPKAVRDLMEWPYRGQPLSSIEELATRILASPVDYESIMPRNRKIALTDDRPINEYYAVRRFIARRRARANPDTADSGEYGTHVSVGR
jgi:spermidine synthase